MYRLALEEAETKLAELIGKVDQGEEVVITREDGRAFRIVPTSAPSGKKRRIIGIAKGQVHLAEDFDAPLADFDAYTS